MIAVFVIFGHSTFLRWEGCKHINTGAHGDALPGKLLGASTDIWIFGCKNIFHKDFQFHKDFSLNFPLEMTNVGCQLAGLISSLKFLLSLYF